jgi:hypothetical protein
MYPILPDLYLDPLDADALWAAPGAGTDPSVAWCDVWRRAMHGYTHEPTSIASYRARVIDDDDGEGLGIFGVTRNPLASVLDLAVRMERPALLLHYACAVVLQFYLCARDLWTRVRTDAGAPYSDAMPAHVALLFRAQHLRIDRGVVLRDVAHIRTRADVDREVMVQSFPLFLFQVLRWMQRTYPRFAQQTHAGSAKDMVESFCTEKVKKNSIQTLTTMRARDITPVNACERMNETLGVAAATHATVGAGAVHTVIKFFPSPKAAESVVLGAPSAAIAERMPIWLTHAWIEPHEPLQQDDAEPDPVLDATPDECARMRRTCDQHVLWKVLRFFPLSDYTKSIVAGVRQMWARDAPTTAADGTAATIIPTDALDKWIEYDGYVRPPPGTRRHMFYVGADNHAYASVPNLHLPEGVPLYDETSPCEMPQRAWDWCIANASADMRAGRLPSMVRTGTGADAGWQPLTGRLEYDTRVVGTLTPNEIDIMRAHLAGGNDLYRRFWCVLRLTGSEEDAVYAVHHEGATLDDLRAAYTRHVAATRAELEAAFTATELAELARGWNRCTAESITIVPGDFTPDQIDLLARAWYTLWPVSSIGMGAQSWSDAWHEAESMPSLAAAMVAVGRALTRPAVMEEVHSASCTTSSSRGPISTHKRAPSCHSSVTHSVQATMTVCA